MKPSTVEKVDETPKPFYKETWFIVIPMIIIFVVVFLLLWRRDMELDEWRELDRMGQLADKFLKSTQYKAVRNQNMTALQKALSLVENQK